MATRRRKGKTPLLQAIKKRFPQRPEKELYALILCGEILVNGEKSLDPHSFCEDGDEIIIGTKPRFVSRGGEKLAGAITFFAVDCAGKIFLDCGASTGGFSDCLLSRGAKKVYAVDVGCAQFDYRLRMDPRVTLMERTNVRLLSAEHFPELPQAAVIDLSFRSLRGVAGHILSLTSERWGIALVKPQFEWRNPPPEFDGVVRDREKLKEILLQTAEELAAEGVFVENAISSPLKGNKGNNEYFFFLSLMPKMSLYTLREKIIALFARPGPGIRKSE